jgi:small multidrug resistance pump
MAWLYLMLAIATEVAGTLQLRSLADAASKWVPVLLVTICYATSFWFMSLALRQIGVGIVYAIWSGVGTAAIAIFGWLLFGERVGWSGVLGMALIVGGVILLVASGSAHASAAAR